MDSGYRIVVGVDGSDGHGRQARAVPGSVAGAAIRAGVCPVVVVPVPRGRPGTGTGGEG